MSFSNEPILTCPAAVRLFKKLRDKPGWEKLYHERLMGGWSMELPQGFLTESVTPLPNGEVWLLAKNGEVVAWKYHPDIKCALFISISYPRGLIGYQP